MRPLGRFVYFLPIDKEKQSRLFWRASLRCAQRGPSAERKVLMKSSANAGLKACSTHLLKIARGANLNLLACYGIYHLPIPRRPIMAEKTAQSFAHHVRWDPAFHFFGMPVLPITFI